MEFSYPRPPAKLFFLLFLDCAHNDFFYIYFLIQIYTSSNDVSLKKIFDSDQKWFFLMIYLRLRNLPPFCSTIRISLLLVGLEPWRRFKKSYSSQAKRFGCISLDRGKYTVENAWEMSCNTLQKVADPKKNISMHKIPFFGEECRVKKKEESQGSISCWRGQRCRRSGRRLFQNTGTTIQMFEFGCELLLLISSLRIYKCRPYFGIYLHILFLSFLLVELVRMVRVSAISF